MAVGKPRNSIGNVGMRFSIGAWVVPLVFVPLDGLGESGTLTQVMAVSIACWLIGLAVSLVGLAWSPRYTAVAGVAVAVAYFWAWISALAALE